MSAGQLIWPCGAAQLDGRPGVCGIWFPPGEGCGTLAEPSRLGWTHSQSLSSVLETRGAVKTHWHQEVWLCWTFRFARFVLEVPVPDQLIRMILAAWWGSAWWIVRARCLSALSLTHRPAGNRTTRVPRPTEPRGRLGLSIWIISGTMHGRCTVNSRHGCVQTLTFWDVSSTENLKRRLSPPFWLSFSRGCWRKE